MALPVQTLPTKTVDVNGEDVEIRSLSRSEALKVQTEPLKNDLDAVEVFILSKGAGVSEDEATKWRDETDPATAGKLIDAIIFLTGFVEEGQPDPKS